MTRQGRRTKQMQDDARLIDLERQHDATALHISECDRITASIEQQKAQIETSIRALTTFSKVKFIVLNYGRVTLFIEDNEHDRKLVDGQLSDFVATLGKEAEHVARKRGQIFQDRQRIGLEMTKLMGVEPLPETP